MQIGCNNVQVITIWENSSHASAGNERMSGLTLSTDNSMNPILLISLNLFKECFIFQQCNETVKCWLETAHYTWTCKVPAHHASRPNKMLTLYVSAKQGYNLSLVCYQFLQYVLYTCIHGCSCMKFDSCRTVYTCLSKVFKFYWISVTKTYIPGIYQVSSVSGQFWDIFRPCLWQKNRQMSKPYRIIITVVKIIKLKTEHREMESFNIPVVCTNSPCQLSIG